jgi:hypothetical protein
MLLYMFFSNNCSKQYLKNTLIQISRGSIDQGGVNIVRRSKAYQSFNELSSPTIYFDEDQS